jgi:hypothetical protein
MYPFVSVFYVTNRKATDTVSGLLCCQYIIILGTFFNTNGERLLYTLMAKGSVISTIISPTTKVTSSVDFGTLNYSKHLYSFS